MLWREVDHRPHIATIMPFEHHLIADHGEVTSPDWPASLWLYKRSPKEAILYHAAAVPVLKRFAVEEG